MTVLGLARSGIALARFLHDMGARVTVYDGRDAAALDGSIAQLDDRQVELRLGPDVDPASTWAGAALVATSPSITPDYPTTEPRLRGAAPGARRGARRRRPVRARARLRVGPVPAAVPRADDRRHRDEGQDDDERRSRTRSSPPTRSTRRSSAATSARRSSSGCPS